MHGYGVRVDEQSNDKRMPRPIISGQQKRTLVKVYANESHWSTCFNLQMRVEKQTSIEGGKLSQIIMSDLRSKLGQNMRHHVENRTNDHYQGNLLLSMYLFRLERQQKKDAGLDLRSSNSGMDLPKFS